jgi:hypothetical protein
MRTMTRSEVVQWVVAALLVLAAGALLLLGPAQSRAQESGGDPAALTEGC